MPTIIKNYCSHCDHPKVDSNSSLKKKVSINLTDMSSRIASRATITAKTIKARPLTSALLTVAVLAAFVAAGVLFGTGFGLIGGAVIGIGITVGTGGISLMSESRKKIEVDAFRKAHALNDRTIQRIKGKDVCLVLESAEDHNKAFRKDKGPAKWEKKYPIVYIKVSTIDDVKKAIGSVAEHANIQVLWHMGHGSEEAFDLGSEDIGIDNLEILKEDYDKLNPAATIVYSSCEIAKGDLARKIAEVADKRVIASSECLNALSIELKMKKGAKIGIQKSRWGSHNGNFKEKAQDLGCSFMIDFTPNFVGKHFKKDIMRVYDKGILQDNRSHYVTV